MTLERWEALKENLRKNFKVTSQKLEELFNDTTDGQVRAGEQEVLEVELPTGKIKVVCEIRPAVLEKKFHYSHRQGDSARTEYKYSDTEKTYKLRIFRWNDSEDDWLELGEQDAGALF